MGFHVSLGGCINVARLLMGHAERPIKTTCLQKGGYMGFHASLGECIKLARLLIGHAERAAFSIIHTNMRANASVMRLHVAYH